MEKCLSIRDQELHVAHLRVVDRGVINLVQNSVRTREPYPARGGIGSAHGILHARGPAGRHARGAEGLALLLKPAVERLITHDSWLRFSVGLGKIAWLCLS